MENFKDKLIEKGSTLLHILHNGGVVKLLHPRIAGDLMHCGLSIYVCTGVKPAVR